VTPPSRYRIAVVDAPVVEISGSFADPESARAVADALNRWFRWIVDGSPPPVPPVFEMFGASSEEYAWSLDEDVDWTLGPHARVVGSEVRLAVQTRDTHLRLAGLLRALGGQGVRVVREAG
jgi:hypothetical protein